jgi:hypothetical protein
MAARRALLGEWLFNQRQSALNIMRIISEQDADCVLLLSNLPFQVRNCGIRCVESLLGLEHVDPSRVE